MTRLYLTRHGQTEWNLEGRMQGSKESALTEKGIEQAKQLGKKLENTNIDVVYSSASGRASHTARLIIGDRELPVFELEELKEMGFGVWEGMTFDMINENYGELHNAFWNTPHLMKEFPGENFEEFKGRVIPSIEKIVREHEGKDILIVAHALVVKILLSHFEQLPLEKLFDDRIIQPTSLSEIEVEGNQYKIIRYADTEHYSINLFK